MLQTSEEWRVLNYDVVMNWPFPDVVQSYTKRDTILYALGIGYGREPTNENDLRYVYESNLIAAPTFPVVLGSPGSWMKDERVGINWLKTLHGEQGLRIFKPLPVEGSVIARNRVVGVIDKGEGRGALMMMERDLIDRVSGELCAVRTATYFLRGDGGCGAPAAEQKPPHKMPDRSPDLIRDISSRPEAALIYRLSGDYNAVHIDPEVAARAGFERPILHGLCTYGMIGRVLVSALCNEDPTRLREIGGRFSAPVYPGETISVDIWKEGANRYSFRARIAERNVIVFNNGLAEVSA